MTFHPAMTAAPFDAPGWIILFALLACAALATFMKDYL
jgi:hypothetical protein